MRIRILVLHVDPVAREGLVATLAKYEDLEPIATEGPIPRDESGSVSYVGRIADVVVADHDCGLELLRLSRLVDDGAASIRIVVLAAYPCEREVRQAVEQGIRGYVLVGCTLDEIAAAVRAVHGGARYLSLEVAERLAESIGSEVLTPREEDVLFLMAEGLGNSAIAQTLRISIGTVKSHVRAIFEKFGVDSRTKAICTAERRGLLRHASQRTANAREEHRARIVALVDRPSRAP